MTIRQYRVGTGKLTEKEKWDLKEILVNELACNIGQLSDDTWQITTESSLGAIKQSIQDHNLTPQEVRPEIKSHLDENNPSEIQTKLKKDEIE